MTNWTAPIGILAELTHRCPLGCPYCSNPLDLSKSSVELDTKTWSRVFAEAGEMGIVHVHLSGGEPMARKDIVELVNAAHLSGLYTNLITSAVGLTPAKLMELRSAGLDHVQISFQGIDPANADALAHYRGASKTKREVAKRVVEEGLAFTLNAVVHRNNIHELPQFVELALELGAGRLEIAHVQYHGWALANRADLMPTREQFEHAAKYVENARKENDGTLVIDHVIPDYYADRPKACMGGWGQRVVVLTPDGTALPCHAAASLPNMVFETVRDKSLADIWQYSDAFNLFRGKNWMPSPCKNCDRAEIDWGGCRCQAFALTGDPSRTDPACSLSPDHAKMALLASERPTGHFRFRKIGG